MVMSPVAYADGAAGAMLKLVGPGVQGAQFRFQSPDHVCPEPRVLGALPIRPPGSSIITCRTGAPERRAIRELVETVSETAAVVPKMTRSNVYAPKPGWMMNLHG